MARTACASFGLVVSLTPLGDSFPSLATPFAAFAFTGSGVERTVRWLMLANGLASRFALRINYRPSIWVASAWAGTFRGATVALAILFGRSATGIDARAGRWPR